MKEENVGSHFDAYSIDAIAQDIKPWLPKILSKPNTALRDFIKGLGWQTEYGHGKSVALYDLKIPVDAIKSGVKQSIIHQLLSQVSRDGTITIKFEINKMEMDKEKNEWQIRIKKTMTDTSI